MSARALLVVLALASAAGCGYQLRGSQGLPEGISSVYVDTRTSGLRNAMSVMLESGGANVAATRDTADVAISITEERFDERLLSVDPDTGKAREYEVYYTLTYSVIGSDGRTVLPSQRLRLVRDYVFDRDAVIGKSRERGVLEEEMRRDAVQQIFYRLNAAR